MHNRTASRAAKLVLLQFGARLAQPVSEKVVRVEGRIADKLKGGSVPVIGAGLRNNIYVATGMLAVARIPVRRLYLEFLNGIRTRYRGASEEARRVIGRAIVEVINIQTVQLVVILVVVIAVHADALHTFS